MDAREIIAQSFFQRDILSIEACRRYADYILFNLRTTGYRILGPDELDRKFKLGDRVTKTKGSSWTGHVVGFYSTSLTPVGYAVESENEPGSVQLYPEAAIRALIKEGGE